MWLLSKYSENADVSVYLFALLTHARRRVLVPDTPPTNAGSFWPGLKNYLTNLK